MSKENNTETTEIDERRTVRIPVNRVDAENVLSQFNAPLPPIDDLTEIHLVIIDEDDANADEIE